MQEKLFLIGIGLIFLGVFTMIIAAFLSGTSKVEGGIVGFIGPFPIGFATSKRMLYLIMVVSLVFFVLLLIFGRRLV